MPITQDRLLALLSAAEDFKRAFERARDIISAQVDAASNMRKSVHEALGIIDRQVVLQNLLENPYTTGAALQTEQNHFKPHRVNTNRRVAAKKAQQRRDAGIPLAQSSPSRFKPGEPPPPRRPSAAPYDYERNIPASLSPMRERILQYEHQSAADAIPMFDQPGLTPQSAPDIPLVTNIPPEQQLILKKETEMLMAREAAPPLPDFSAYGGHIKDVPMEASPRPSPEDPQ